MSLFKRLIGRVACWGNGDHGRLGGHPIARAIPTIVDALMHQNFVSIKCGGAHTAAVGVDGSVFTWGLNDHGQLGHYTHQEISMQEPQEVLLPEAAWDVAVGHSHTLFLTESSSVWAVGSNRYGQLGLGRTGTQEWLPRRVQDLVGTKIVSIAAGALHSLAISAEGELFTWGSGMRGCLGHGNSVFGGTQDESAPRLVRKLNGVKVQSAAGGLMNSGCVDANGAAYVWGPYLRQSLRQAATEANEPEVLLGVQNVKQLAMGGRHLVALTHGGRVATFGTSEYGILGLGSSDPPSPFQPTLIPDMFLEQVAAGWQHSAGYPAKHHGTLGGVIPCGIPDDIFAIRYGG
ncbi:hypothetical protein WJX75_009704 [Coccomyxa subellipsoidea]|uniref:RCC1-like domain-containing protein n=1 Tax=Coccomyxa subellipsoidea TaxID=248742 RepID=A0ABR2YNP0_9CHLO